MERTQLRNQESIRIHGEEENYKKLGTLEADTIRQTEMREKVRKVSLSKIK